MLKGILDHRLKDQEKWPYPFPYTYWQVRGLLTARYFKRIGLKANLQTLRDTAATLRQLSGQSLSAVSALLGHRVVRQLQQSITQIRIRCEDWWQDP